MLGDVLFLIDEVIRLMKSINLGFLGDSFSAANFWMLNLGLFTVGSLVMIISGRGDGDD